jgi:hypothetical protein
VVLYRLVLGFSLAGALSASKGLTVSIKNFEGSGWSRVFYFALSNLVSLGCEFGTPNNSAALWLVMSGRCYSRVVGALLNLVFLGIIMSKFSIPRHSVVFSRISDGNPVLTFRLANVDGEAMIQPDFHMAVVMKDKVSLQDDQDDASAGTTPSTAHRTRPPCENETARRFLRPKAAFGAAVWVQAPGFGAGDLACGKMSHTQQWCAQLSAAVALWLTKTAHCARTRTS